MVDFKKAVRSKRKLRTAIDGPSGSGKTFTALRLAFALLAAGLGKKIAVIDTENESASLYVGESPDGVVWEFDTAQLTDYAPDKFTAAINTAVKAGFDIIVVDSLSHAWTGKGGALDLVDGKGGNKFTAWKDVTPLHRAMVDAIIQSPANIIVTMRSKTEYVLEEETNRDGKKVMVPRKVGMAPIQRDGMEYEFDVYASMDDTHQLKVTKTRCSPLDRATGIKPGPEFWAPLFDWLKSGAPSPPRAEPEPELVKEPPPHSPEGKPEGWTYAGALEKQIDEATTLDGMTTLGQTIATAVQQKHINKAEADKLREKFKAKVTALKAAMSASVATTTDTKST